MQGKDDGETGVDDRFARRAMEGFGAFILGRNMFGPVRGAWPDDQWKGWWGENPPYHAPTFILTHHPRAPIEMQGGTVFHFVTDGIDSALKQARAAAGVGARDLDGDGRGGPEDHDAFRHGKQPNTLRRDSACAGRRRSAKNLPVRERRVVRGRPGSAYIRGAGALGGNAPVNVTGGAERKYRFA